LAKSLSDLASVVQQQGDLEQARRLLEEAIKLRRIQVYQFPEELRNQESLANSLGELAAVAKRSGDLQESQLLLEESIALLTQLVESEDGGRFRGPLSDKYVALYGVLAEQGLEPEARVAWSKAHEFNPSHRQAPWRGRSMFSRRPESSHSDSSHTDSNQDESNRNESNLPLGDRNRLAPADADE
jgi:tetratricopeptide (TPR) repeat protein